MPSDHRKPGLAFVALGDRRLTIAGEASSSVASLRSRWNRAFGLLFLVVLVGAAANFAAIRTLVGTFRDSARQVEDAAWRLAELRSDIVPHALALARAEDAAVGRRLVLAASIEASFGRAITGSRSPGEKRLLEKALVRWQTMVAAADTLDGPPPGALPGMPIAIGVAEVSSLLDQASEVSRAHGRAELARAEGSEREAVAALAAVIIVVAALMIRFARRLSTEVLRPVGILRDSAHQLTEGHLDHRVKFNQRTDELGDLAVSFNAMADAIADSQTSLAHQASHDPLTGLANRGAFRARLEVTMARPERRHGTQAVLFVDLDDFKGVNDALGHAAGDELLCVVAARLDDTVRPGDLVARLGGDEFAVLLDGVTDAAVALSVAERAVAALAAPVEIAGTRVKVCASAGLAMRHHGSDPDLLMREADAAMYMAKGRGKNRVECYDAPLHEAILEQLTLKAELAGATGRGELVLDYQPIVDLTTGRFAGMEALVRWQHPTRGLLPPSAFIGLAEQTDAIVGIGSWVLETATGQLRSWQRRYGLPDLTVAVNVSVCQLTDPGFAGHLAAVLARTRLEPRNLIVEVTESVLADPAGGTTGSLEALRRLGVQVALDDFGTGYSSISYLRRLPVDILKIDRSFVSGEHADRPGDLLLEAIVGLAQRLGLDVIPEGIETRAQLARLQTLGCRTGQGFLLARPAPAAAIDELLAAPVPLLSTGSPGVPHQ